MTAIKPRLETWPTNVVGEPIFKTTNDAIFYAQLASRKINAIDKIKAYRKKARRDLKNSRQVLKPNLDQVMQYAVKAQFFRECYEEIERINGENKQ